MPPIEVVEGSICNADPENPAEWEVRGGRRLSCTREGGPARHWVETQVPLG